MSAVEKEGREERRGEKSGGEERGRDVGRGGTAGAREISEGGG